MSNLQRAKEFVFNTVWNHFIAQDKPLSYVGDMTCFLRHPYNPEIRCVVGLFIEDCKYSLDLESRLSIATRLASNNIASEFGLDFAEQKSIEYLLSTLRAKHDVSADFPVHQQKYQLMMRLLYIKEYEL